MFYLKKQSLFLAPSSTAPKSFIFVFYDHNIYNTILNINQNNMDDFRSSISFMSKRNISQCLMYLKINSIQEPKDGFMYIYIYLRES